MHPLIKAAMASYVGEACCICGKQIERREIADIVVLGKSEDDQDAVAHKQCLLARDKNNKGRK